MKRKFLKLFAIVFFCIVFIGCKTPRVISIKSNSKTHENKLIISTPFRKIEFGIVLIKPLALSFAGAEVINSLTLLNEEGNIIWEIHSKEKNVGDVHIKYGKLNTRFFEQVFPLQNNPPAELKLNHEYLLKLATSRGSYEKPFIYQPSEIYIFDDDRK